MFDDRPEIKPHLDQTLVAWLTTVSPSGQPQPSPVWFVTTDDSIVVYSKEGTPRLRNIEAGGKVALNLNSDDDGDDVLIVEGEAEIVGTDLPPSGDPTYVAKYEAHLPRWGFTWGSYDRGYPMRILIRPRRLRAHMAGD